MTQQDINAAILVITQLWLDYQRLNARCERLEQELNNLRDYLHERSTFPQS